LPSARRAWLAALLFGLALLAPAAGCRSRPDGPTLVIHPAGRPPVTVTVELATTPEKRTYGLMYRRQLAPDAGMLFVFPQEAPQQFWMHNTQIALDIMYIEDDGRIARIYERTTPLSDTALPSGTPVRFVLEVVGGFSARHGIQAGDPVELGALARTPSS